MSFSIEVRPFGPYEECVLRNNETEDYFSFIPYYGACMNLLRLNGKDVLSGSHDFDSFAKTLSQYRGSKLFPYPNRIANAEYEFEGEIYHLPQNDPPRSHNLHGLVFDKKFKLSEKSEEHNKCSVTATYSYDGSYSGYPFSFDISITYTLYASSIEVKTHIINTGEVDIPVGDGWHPYVQSSNSIDTVKLKLPKVVQLELDDVMIPSGTTITYDDFEELTSIGLNSFDNCFKLKDVSGDTSNVLLEIDQSTSVNIWAENGVNKYKYWQVYTPDERNSIAIEPMTCPPNVLNSKEDLVLLAPGENWDLKFGIEII